MRKIHLLVFAVFAMFAFSVAIAATASAAPTFLLAEWLIGGNPIPTGTTAPSLVEGELTLTDLKVPILGEVSILCSGSLVGVLKPNGEDQTTTVFNLGETEQISSSPLVGKGLACTNIKNCAFGSPQVYPVHLPWNTLLELLEETGVTNPLYVDLILNGGTGNPGWEVECPFGTDECTASAGVVEVKNNATSNDVDTQFTEAIRELAEAPLATCTQSGEASGHVVSDALALLTSTAGTVAASSQ
jgi:hypothetical protein